MDKIQVAILMGSKSDLPVMRKAAECLDGFDVHYRMTIASAHRSPGIVADFIAQTQADGAQVFIAGAGAAAHLAGAVASMTTKPVIGIPLGSKLSGFDSLLSTVQMPSGIPVATVAVEGSVNAALLAVQIIALSDQGLADKLAAHRTEMAETVARNAEALKTAA